MMFTWLVQEPCVAARETSIRSQRENELNGMDNGDQEQEGR